jgi:hypothetical protein
MSEEQSAYLEILERNPPVVWAMPEDRPDHHDLAAKNEYDSDRLQKAAEIVWMAEWAWHGDKEFSPSVADADPDDLAAERAELAAVLENGGPRNRSQIDCWRWKALQIMNIPRILSSSSAFRERTEQGR